MLASACGGDGGNGRLLEGAVLPAGGRGVRVRAGRCQAGQEPPGRPKRDPADSRWLAACFERGAVTACFVAAPEFRIIRLHTRYRRDLTEELTREKQRAEKLLESAAIKISSVPTHLHRATGLYIMDQLIARQRNPKARAQLARTAARRKISQLEEALEGAEVLYLGARRAAGQGTGPHRPAVRRYRGPVPGDLVAAGPVRGAAGPGRVDARLGCGAPPRTPLPKPAST